MFENIKITTSLLSIAFLSINSFLLFGELEVAANTNVPQYLYKTISTEAWEQSQQKQKLQHSSMDDAFIHLATEEQLPHVVRKFWPNIEHVALKVEVQMMNGNLIHEANPGGTTKYFHLYDGNIPFNAIKEVILSSEYQ
jgi:uncharacterized protein (DUF952 family)